MRQVVLVLRIENAMVVPVRLLSRRHRHVLVCKVVLSLLRIGELSIQLGNLVSVDVHGRVQQVLVQGGRVGTLSFQSNLVLSVFASSRRTKVVLVLEHLVYRALFHLMELQRQTLVL